MPGDSTAQCLILWRNMFTLQKMCPITAVDFDYNLNSEVLKIFIGDEMGFV